MDRNYIDRYLVVDRFLSGDLTDSEVADFEERLVWDRELIDEVDLAASLREGMRASADAAASAAPAPQPGRPPVFGRMAIAASFAAGILATSLFFNQALIPVSTDLASTQVVPLELLRSTDMQQIAVDPNGVTVLMVAVGDVSGEFAVELFSEGDSRAIWSQSGLTVGYLASLAVGVPGELLQPDNYVLRVYADAAMVQEIPFKTVFKE